MPSLAVIYDPRRNSWLRFRDPVEEIEIHEPDQVMPALQRIEQRVEREGLYAAGYLSYESAAAFDEALQTWPAGDFPLLRFGLFAAMEEIDLPAPPEAQELPQWRPLETADKFARNVDAIRAAIARGETYQVNLTFPLTTGFTLDPWSFFLHLARGQQASGAGYLQSDRWAICSVSPELFFARDGHLLTMRPMKGTAARGRTLDEDLLVAEGLKSSAKNRAENIMILDMVRNDLGRIAPPGEVRTEAICSLERYPTVWQLTSTASAQSEASLAEIFQALFPCASITGAPKAQTMRIITAIEAGPRGIYTGAFGWVAPKRQAHFNVAIRTALIDRRQKSASYGVGAGITWDSVSDDEYQECLDKAAVLEQSGTDFALIETLRWAPRKGYFVLSEHLSRLQASAKYFDFVYSGEAVERYLSALSRNFPVTAQRVRLLLHSDGRLEGSFEGIAPAGSSFLKLSLAKQPVDSKNVLLFHKTTRRQIYAQYLAGAGDADEVVLWNERGEVTECCTANLVVEIAGNLLTPPLSSGLLPGTYREYLLRRNILQERVLTPEDLHRCSRIFLINAVRKWRRAKLF